MISDLMGSSKAGEGENQRAAQRNPKQSRKKSNKREKRSKTEVRLAKNTFQIQVTR